MKGTVFIAVRHGHYNRNQDLSQEGAEQMRTIAGLIKEINTAGLPISLICSMAPRAFQGGQIFIEELAIPEDRVTFTDGLWDDNNHHADRSEARKLVADNLHENSILLALSHLDLVPTLARHVAEKFGHQRGFGESEYGQGWLISRESCQQVPA